MSNTSFHGLFGEKKEIKTTVKRLYEAQKSSIKSQMDPPVGYVYFGKG